MIRKRYSKAEELTREQCLEAYSLVRVKYKLMGVELPEIKPNDGKEQTMGTPDMKNKIQDLRNHLFETIEKLKDGEIDIEKARAISDLSQVIVNSAKVEVDFLRAANVKSSYFFPVEEAKQIT